ncbi:MAG TPA: tRNA (adenosine(37)-N6)-dimethylallyltransferase MiaA [Solirubrobacterales bacterium]|nr:tRNA (adenosine(37)-N6)-dimethylallyltransferase MiaA [Solirubrobacterales bacterium]
MPELVAIFGPTAAGKTGVAVALAEDLRRRGEEPVAVSCDAIQVYRGLEIVSGAASADERRRLEHRLVGFLDPSEEFSVGRFAALAHAEIDDLLGAGRRPIVVGGTGLYLRAALADLDLRPAVPAEVRDEVEAEIAARGPDALHAELPSELSAAVHPNDRKRIARWTELRRAGIEPAPSGDRLWTASPRRPSRLFGLVADRELLDRRIAARVEAMAVAGAVEQAREADRRGISRTARAALGFDEMLAADLEAVKAVHRRYARRQLTWMRRMPRVEIVDRGDRGDAEVAAEIAGILAPR